MAIHRTASRPQSDTEKPHRRRNDLLRNVLMLGALWVAYSAVRGVTAGHFSTAVENAESIINLQQNLGLPSEATIQYAVIGHTWLIKAANFYYIVVHFPFTIAFMVWTWRFYRDKFGRVRNALIATTSAGLALHVIYPLTPPRMMRGFVDTARLFGPDPYELGIASAANQLAAMPSLHVGWSLLVALGVIWISSSRLKWLIIIHPVVTVAVVVLTANHYWIDAIAAAAIVSASWQLTHPITTGEAFLQPPAESPELRHDRRTRERVPSRH